MDRHSYSPNIDPADAQGANPLATMNPQDARAFFDPIITRSLGPPEKVARVDDLTIPGPDENIPIRIYTPQGHGPFPVLVYFHGGGWLLGSLDTHDSLCRKIANRGVCVVASVGYRLSPEAKFPSALEDAYLGFSWVRQNTRFINVSPHHIAVGGDSSGGNLAASVVLMNSRDKGMMIDLLVLIYPVTDFSSFYKDSYRKYKNKLLLTRNVVSYFKEQYLQRMSDVQNPLASPLLSTELANFPNTLIMTAEHDVLTSDGALLAAKLKENGVQVQYSCYPGAVHGFFGMHSLTEDKNGLAEVASALKKAFNL